MSMVISFTRVTPEALDKAVDDPEWAEEHLDELDLTDEPDGYLDKAWDGIHRCLTEGQLGSEDGSYPLNAVILGGLPLYQGEDYVISSSTLNSVRVAFNRTAITRTSTDFFSAPEVGINIYSYMPHYMLLTVSNGFSLGGGTESESNFTTPAWQISDDLTLVRGAHQFAVGVNVAGWKSL